MYVTCMLHSARISNVQNIITVTRSGSLIRSIKHGFHKHHASIMVPLLFHHKNGLNAIINTGPDTRIRFFPFSWACPWVCACTRACIAHESHALKLTGRYSPLQSCSITGNKEQHYTGAWGIKLVNYTTLLWSHL